MRPNNPFDEKDLLHILGQVLTVGRWVGVRRGSQCSVTKTSSGRYAFYWKGARGNAATASAACWAIWQEAGWTPITNNTIW